MKNTIENFNYLFGLPNGIFKWKYFNECQRVFTKHYGIYPEYWKPNIDNVKRIGLHDKDGNWHPFNRINTHPKIAWYFYGLAIKHDPNMFSDFDNPNNFTYNIVKLWDWLDNNFELIFTKNITDEHFNNIMFFLENSWTNGNITMLIVLSYCPIIFPTATKFIYDFKTGGYNDMNGIDIEIILPDDKIKTIQVKSGSYKKYSNKTYIVGSQNTLSYKSDYYAYASTKYNDNKSSIILFINNDTIEKNEKGTLIINNDLIIFNETTDMNNTEKLNEMVKLCSKHRYMVEMTNNEGDNNIVFDTTLKKLIINFHILTDTNKNFEKKIESKLEEMKTYFNEKTPTN